MEVTIAISVSAHQLSDGNLLHILIAACLHQITYKIGYQEGNRRSLKEATEDIAPVMLVVRDATHARVEDEKDEPCLIEML